MKKFFLMIVAALCCMTAVAEENEKLVAITFDDGPNTTTTVKVLDVLEENGVVATFFLCGKDINSSTRAVMKRAVKIGCELENHSRSHSHMSGMTADQLSEMIRESLRDELRQLHPEPSAETPNYLTRRETARRLRISLVTLNDWVNRGRIRAHKIGGRVLFRDSDVEAALHRIVPIKSR